MFAVIEDLGNQIQVSEGDIIKVANRELSQDVATLTFDQVLFLGGEGEDAKIAVRNLRRDANEHLKRLTKDKEISEDDERRATDDIQKMTDRAVVEIDKLVSEKEKEIMTV